MPDEATVQQYRIYAGPGYLSSNEKIIELFNVVFTVY